MTILVSSPCTYSLISQSMYPKFCAVYRMDIFGEVFFNYYYYQYAQIIHYSTTFWELTSPGMLYNCFLSLLKSCWISLFLLSSSVCDFIYTILSSNLTFFCWKFITQLLSVKTALQPSVKGCLIKVECFKIWIFWKKVKFHLEGSNVRQLDELI